VWLLGTLITFAIGIGVVAIIGRHPRLTSSRPVWDISSLGGTYTGIVGTLGGFSVTSAVFVAGLEGARASPEFAAVIGMLLVAFLILVFSALLYASTPNGPGIADDAVTPSLSHLLANMCGCLGLAVSWLALVPFLRLLSLTGLAEAFTWLLLSVTIAGACWVALFAYHLTLAPISACLALPAIGVALPALYRLAAARIWPALWPTTDSILHYAFVALAVSALIFATHLAVLAICSNEPKAHTLQHRKLVLTLALSAANTIAVGFMWFAVAAP
jgi:hypothetical protein